MIASLRPLAAATLVLATLAIPVAAQDAASALTPDIPGMQFDNLPRLTVSKTVKVPVMTSEGADAGFIQVPEGLRFHPDAVDATYAYETMMNGQYMRIKLEDTNWAEVKPKPSDKPAGDDATMTNETHPGERDFHVDDEVVGRVRIDEILPNGFLADQFETANAEGEDDIYISGLDTSRLKQGEWWTGTVYYVGVWSKPGGSKTYRHFSVNPKADKDVTTPTTGNDPASSPTPDAKALTYAEMQKLYNDLQLQETSNNLKRLTVNDTRSAASVWTKTTPTDKLKAEVRRNQVNWLGSAKPNWDNAAKTAQDWLKTREMPSSYRNWLQQVVATQEAMAPASIGQFRRGVSKLMTDWRVIESLYGSQGG